MEKSKIFLTADLHLGHKNIIKYENRPFINIDMMHETIIKNWNNVITNNDKVYILGDLTFTNKEKTKNIIEQLNGKIYLIKGNHDVKPNQWYRDCGITEIYDYPILYNEYFIFCHEPMYVNNNAPYAMIHGHVHSSLAYSTFTPRSCCVSMERWNYTPVNFNIILLNMQKLDLKINNVINKFEPIKDMEANA